MITNCGTGVPQRRATLGEFRVECALADASFTSLATFLQRSVNTSSSQAHRQRLMACMANRRRLRSIAACTPRPWPLSRHDRER